MLRKYTARLRAPRGLKQFLTEKKNQKKTNKLEDFISVTSWMTYKKVDHGCWSSDSKQIFLSFRFISLEYRDFWCCCQASLFQSVCIFGLDVILTQIHKALHHYIHYRSFRNLTIAANILYSPEQKLTFNSSHGSSRESEEEAHKSFKSVLEIASHNFPKITHWCKRSLFPSKVV